MGNNGVQEHTLQLAMFNQARDARQWGMTLDGVAHPTWEELTPAALEEYMQDARMTVRAMLAIGWEPAAATIRSLIAAAKRGEWVNPTDLEAFISKESDR